MNKQPSWLNEYYAYFHFKNGKKIYAKYKDKSVTEVEKAIQKVLNTKYKDDDLFVALYCKDYFHQDVFIKMITKEDITQYNFITNNYQNVKMQNMEQKHYKTFGEMWQGDTLYSIQLYYDVNNGIVINDICEEEYTNITFEQDNTMLNNERFMRIWLPNMTDTIWVSQKDRQETFTTTLRNKSNLKIGGTGENTVRTFYFLDKDVIPAIVAYYAVMVQTAIREYQKECEKMFVFADKVLDKLCEWGNNINYKVNDCITLLDKTCISLDNAYNKSEYEIIKSTVECQE